MQTPRSIFNTLNPVGKHSSNRLRMNDSGDKPIGPLEHPAPGNGLGNPKIQKQVAPGIPSQPVEASISDYGGISLGGRRFIDVKQREKNDGLVNPSLSLEDIIIDNKMYDVKDYYIIKKPECVLRKDPAPGNKLGIPKIKKPVAPGIPSQSVEDLISANNNIPNPACEKKNDSSDIPASSEK